MVIWQRFRKGVALADASLRLFWKHNYLIFYFCASALIGVATQFIKFNAINLSAQFTHFSELHSLIIVAYNSPSWLQAIGLTALLCASIFVIFFFNAGLIYHCISIIKHEEKSFTQSLYAVIPKLTPIGIWAILSCLHSIILLKIEKSASLTVLNISFVFLSIVWSLATFLVLPIIVIESRSLLGSIAQSARLVWNELAWVLGGTIWLGMIMAVLAFPVHFMGIFIKKFALIPPAFTFGLLLGLALAIKCLLSTAYALFKVMLYHRSYTK